MIIRDLNDMSLLITGALPFIRRLDFDVIVHIPRSGTIPASILATYLRKPLASVEEFCAEKILTRKSEFETLNRILVVDDSVRTGEQMKAAVDRIKTERPDAEIKTLAIFSTRYPNRMFSPDMVLDQHEDGEYIYPWFLWKTKRIKNFAVDMDGVLCRDCRKEENDDGVNYANFLKTADLKFKTSYPIGWIVTARLQKYRAETSEWLERHGIKYKNLIMGPWENNADRKEANPGAWKASVYKKIASNLFIESSDKEAQVIAQKTGKSVWCIDTQRRY